MKHTYDIQGMTCQSCAEKVRGALLSLNGIEEVDVDLEKAQAEVTMGHHVPTTSLQDALRKAGDYKISEEDHSTAGMADDEEEAYSFKPLILVIGFILLLVFISEYNTGRLDMMEAMRKFMGGFFIAFSFFKLLDLKGFAYNYLSYDIITKKWMTWGFIYPFVELALGIAYLISFQLTWTLSVTILVMGLSSIGVIQTVLDKKKIKCACLGTGFNLPMSTVTIIEDVGMVLMAIGMLIAR